MPPALLEGRGRAFVERYVARFGREPECYTASAYDATGAILQAIERVGRLDRAAIIKAAFATPGFDGLLGRWSFDANGDVPRTVTPAAPHVTVGQRSRGLAMPNLSREIGAVVLASHRRRHTVLEALSQKKRARA